MQSITQFIQPQQPIQFCGGAVRGLGGAHVPLYGGGACDIRTCGALAHYHSLCTRPPYPRAVSSTASRAPQQSLPHTHNLQKVMSHLRTGTECWTAPSSASTYALGRSAK